MSVFKEYENENKYLLRTHTKVVIVSRKLSTFAKRTTTVEQLEIIGD